jgi:hypothetical protein
MPAGGCASEGSPEVKSRRSLAHQSRIGRAIRATGSTRDGLVAVRWRWSLWKDQTLRSL